MTIISKKIEPNLLLSNFNTKIESPRDTLDNRKPEFDCCQTPNIIESRGLYVCTNCGIDYGPVLKEYRSCNPSNQVYNSYKHVNFFYQGGPRTFFTFENLLHSNKSQFKRLAKLNKNYISSYEQNLSIAYRHLFTIASQLQIPFSLISSTFQLYLQVLKRRLTVGRNIRFLMASCLFLSCHYHQFKCNLKDISDCCRIPEKVLRKNYRLILKELQIKLYDRPASYYLSQFCFDLGLSTQFQNLALEFLDSFLQTDKHANIAPKILAVDIIYIISKTVLKEKRLKQEDLSKISKVSGVTLRKYLKVCKTVMEIFLQERCNEKPF